jgi:galactokinase
VRSAPNIGTTASPQRVERLLEAFRERFGRPAEGLAEAPGRVNLIGEHLDYNEGCVLPAAIDRTILVAFARRPDRQVRLYSLDFAQESVFDLDAIRADAEHAWSNYLRGVAWALEDRGYALVGLEAALQGDVPVGAGLASSGALEVAGIGAFAHAGSLELGLPEVALLGQRAENEFVGVECGIMDQFAAALSVAEHALLIDCRTLEHEPVPIHLEAQGVCIVVADTGARRELTASEYNRRRQECVEALELLRGQLPERSLRALRDVTREDLTACGQRLPAALRRRVRHVVEEQARVEQAVSALRANDLAAVGRLFDASHASLRDDYEVSSPELDLMVELAGQVEGCLGARLTGAGFGGCTVNLVRSDAVEAFQQEVVERCARRTGLPARMYVTAATGGLRTWDLI